MLLSTDLLFIIRHSHGFAMDLETLRPTVCSDQSMAFRTTQVTTENKVRLLHSYWVKWSCLVLLGLQLNFPGCQWPSPALLNWVSLHSLSLLSTPSPLSCSSIFVLCPMAVSPGSACIFASLVRTVAGSPSLCPVALIIVYLYNAQVFLFMWLRKVGQPQRLISWIE